MQGRMVTARGIADRLGHIGLWAGLYVTAAYICFWQLAAAGSPGSLPRVNVVISVLLAATAVYAFDRVKLLDEWIDPADRAALPERYQFLTQHTLVIRSLAVALLVIAVVLAYFAAPLLPVVIAMSIVGVIAYAPGPRGSLPRLKDVVGVKNLYVAGGVVALAIVATVLIGPLSRVHGDAFWQLARVRLGPLIDAALLLLLRVIIDAAICDIDDAESDAAHGTRTLPHLLGKRKTLAIAIAARGMLAILILLVARAPLATRCAWAGLGLGSALMLIPLRHKPLRDWVDVSFAIEAFAITILAAAWG